MIGIAILTLLPVVLGVALALLPELLRRVHGPVRAMAALAAVAVVFGVLLPEGWAAAGPWALLWLVVGFFAPVLFEWLAQRLGGTHAEATIAMAGLLLHQAADGLEIGAAHRLGNDALSVAGAIALHTIPVIGILIRPEDAPARVVLLRGLALLVVTGAGLAVGVGATAHLPHGEGWLPVLLGGVLLHVLAHGLRRPHPSGG